LLHQWSKVLSLRTIIENQGSTLTARFQLSKDMITESDEIFLVVVQEPIQGSVQTGFLGFGSCDGTGKTSLIQVDLRHPAKFQIKKDWNIA